MSDDLVQRLVIEGSGNAAAVVAKVTESLEALNRQLAKTAKGFQRAFGPEMVKPLAAARVEAERFGVDLAEAASKAERALRGDVAAIAELRAGLRGAVADEKALGSAMRASQAAGTRAARTATTSARNAATGRATAAADDLRGWRARQRIKAASERADAADLRRRLAAGRTLLDIRRRTEAAELRERERAGNAWAASQRRKLSIMDRSAAVEVRRQREADRVEATKARAESVAIDQRVRDVGRVWRMRQASEAAEARHLATMRREQAAMRRSAMGAGRHAYGHAQHALRSVNHPAFESAGFWVTAGAAFGVEAGRHLLEAARNLDTVTTRMSMMPGVAPADAAKVRSDALRESMRIGLDPAEVVRLQLQGIKDGLSPALAKSLPAIVNAAVQTMGGDINRDGDELAKAVREASTVGWVKDATSARSLMNQVAGLSTFNGNSPEKMNQFLASGGIGRGKELGWSQEQTLAFGAALNGSGERTGFGSARLMAQIPEIRAAMRDRYIHASRSHDNSEEHRATRSAPRLLGYGGISAMQKAFASPEGVSDFLSRLSQLPEQTRAAIEKGYGLGPQFNAVAAEMGADHGHRYHEAMRRERELAGQSPENDDLSKNSKLWSGSIDFMLGQLKASVTAVQSELGDVIKTDILTPFTGWWVNVSEALLDGGMKADLHKAIKAFIEGLGFSDLTAALDALRGSVGTFDLAGFMRGIGEGLRAFVDEIRSLASAFGGTGGLSAETIGRLAAELFGLSVALHVMAPFVTIIGGIASAFLAIKAAVEGVAIVARLTGIADGLRAIVGVELAATAGGLLSLAGGLMAIGAAVQALLSAGILNKIELPHDMSAESWDRFAWGRKPDGTSARPAWVDRLFGGGTDEDRSHLVTGPHGGLMYRQSYEGGEDPNNWRNLLTRASYEPSDAGNIARTAAVDTARGVVEVREAVDRLASVMRSNLSGSGLGGSGDSGGAFGGSGGAQNPSSPNIRYGRQHMGRGGSVGAGPGDTSGHASAMKGGESERAGRAMAKLMSLGWSKEAAAAAVGNAQQESGVRSDGPLGDTKRFGFGDAAAHGMFQWRDQRFRDLRAFAAKKGTSWQDFDTQVEFFDHESKKYGSEKWRKTNNVYEANVGMQRFEGYGDKSFGTRLANARQILAGKTGGGFYASQGQTVDVAAGGGSAGKAVDIAMGMQGAGERSAQQILGAYMHPGEWCADFVNGALQKAGIRGSGSAMAGSFSGWGRHIDTNAVQKGDVIEERHGNHVGHVGLATGNVQRDRNGNVTAVEMVSGNYGHMVRKNWEKVGLIADLRRSDQAVAAAARKVGEAVARPAAPSKASDIAGKVHSGGRPKPGTGDAPAGSMNSADNSSMVNHFHIHGAHDPHHVARTVVAHLDRVNSRYTDGERVA